MGRQHPDRIPMSAKTYAERAEVASSRFKTMVDYMQQSDLCRAVFLLEYFGEKNQDPCGRCDVCLKNKDRNIELLEQKILNWIDGADMPIEKLEKQYLGNPEILVEALRNLLDQNLIEELSSGHFRKKS
jgi:ATP-dependent DNA helicase RecQ